MQKIFVGFFLGQKELGNKTVCFVVHCTGDWPFLAFLLESSLLPDFFSDMEVIKKLPLLLYLMSYNEKRSVGRGSVCQAPISSKGLDLLSFRKSQQYDCKWYIPLTDLSFQMVDESEAVPNIPLVPDEELDAMKIKISQIKNDIQREKVKKG